MDGVFSKVLGADLWPSLAYLMLHNPPQRHTYIQFLFPTIILPYSNAMLGISAKNCCVAGVDSFLDGFRMLLTVLLVISGTL